MPHQLVADVTCNKKVGEQWASLGNARLINSETSTHILGIKLLTLIPPWPKLKTGRTPLNTGLTQIKNGCLKWHWHTTNLPTFLVLMHWWRRRGHLHSQAIGPSERVTVPNNKGSRLPLSQQANSCNAVHIQLVHIRTTISVVTHLPHGKSFKINCHNFGDHLNFHLAQLSQLLHVSNFKLITGWAVAEVF